MTNYSHVMDKILGTPWVIQLSSLETILEIVERRLAGERIDSSEYTFGPDMRENLQEEDVSGPGVGVLNIAGPIFPKANMMTQMSGATSIEQLQSNFRALLASSDVTSIVLNIDSPGGMSDLIMEMGDEIYQGRSVKPIIAVANTTAASAAYWLGSQADKFFVTPSGQVGSVGVYTVHQDKSAQMEKEGISTTMISAGKFKVEGSPFGPLSDEAKAHMQERVDETYNEFVNAVARGRGTSEEVVREAYGDGRTYRAKTALAMGMVDGIETLDSIVGKLVAHGGGDLTVSGTLVNSEKEDNTMDELSPELLEALGLGEDATTEDIETTVMQLVTEITPLRNAAAVQIAFAEQFPEQAAMLEELKEKNLVQSAKLFSESYEKLSDGSGFSAVALELIEETHKKISSGIATHDDFKQFLDTFKEGTAIVDYTEHGTSRESDVVEATDSRDAAKQIATLAKQAQIEAGGASQMSWGDAVAQVTTEHPELAQAYLGGDE